MVDLDNNGKLEEAVANNKTHEYDGDVSPENAVGIVEGLGSAMEKTGRLDDRRHGVEESRPVRPSNEGATQQPIGESASVAALAEDNPPTQAPATTEGVASEETPALSEFSVEEWDYFCMMLRTIQQQRQMMRDFVTAILIRNSYGLKNTVPNAPISQGEIDHGILFELCAGLYDGHAGSAFDDLGLGDIPSDAFASFLHKSYGDDSFFTNLSGGGVMTEDTEAFSPKDNLINDFQEKVDVDFGFDYEYVDEDILAGADPVVTSEMTEYYENVSQSSAEAADAFYAQMLMVSAISRLVRYAIRAVMLIALFIGSCLLCTVNIDVVDTNPFVLVLLVLGFLGYVTSLVLAFRLYKDIKHNR